MKDLFRHLWRYRKKVIVGIIALLLVDVGQLFVPQVIRVGVDDISAGNMDRLPEFAGILLGIGLIVAFLRFFWRYFILGAARQIRRDIRNELYDRMLVQSARFYEQHPTGDLMAHFSNDTNAIMRATGIGLLALCDFVIMAAIATGFMIAIQPTLTLYAFLPLPLLTIFIIFFGKKIYGYFQLVQDRFSVLSDRVQEVLSGIQVVKAFSREPELQDHFAKHNDAYRDEQMNLVRFHGLLRPVIYFLSGGSMIIVIYFGSHYVVEGSISLGDLIAFNMYLGMLTWPMMALGWGINLMQRGSASMDRINRLLHDEPAVQDSPAPVALETPRNIEFRDLSFSYGQNERVLDEISFQVERGEAIGLIGSTGSGKSTLLHLLMRIYDPPPGTIRLNGQEIRDIALRDLRRELSLVPQKSLLFSTSVRDNIAFGRPEASDEEIRRAAKQAGIHEEIMEAERQYETLVGEKGVSLSGGQKQRVALARALLTDPPVLLLDDTLSSVDARKQREIIRNLEEFREDRILVVISHRITTVRHLDRILVLDDGVIREQGTHENLLRQDGLYKKLFELEKARTRREVS